MNKKWYEKSQANPRVDPGYYLAKITKFESSVSTKPETHGIRYYGAELALHRVDLNGLRRRPTLGEDTGNRVCVYFSPSAQAASLRGAFERGFFIDSGDSLGKIGLISIGRANHNITPVDEDHGLLVYLPSLRRLNGQTEQENPTPNPSLTLPLAEIQRHLTWLKFTVREQTSKLYESPNPQTLRLIAARIDAATSEVCHYVHTGRSILGESPETGEEKDRK